MLTWQGFAPPPPEDVIDRNQKSICSDGGVAAVERTPQIQVIQSLALKLGGIPHPLMVRDGIVAFSNGPTSFPLRSVTF
jgi:hypothetical protein